MIAYYKKVWGYEQTLYADSVPVIRKIDANPKWCTVR